MLTEAEAQADLPAVEVGTILEDQVDRATAAGFEVGNLGEIEGQDFEEVAAVAGCGDFDPRFEPAAKRRQVGMSGSRAGFEQLEIAADTTSGMGGVGDGLTQVEQGICLVGKTVGDSGEELVNFGNRTHSQ